MVTPPYGIEARAIAVQVDGKVVVTGDARSPPYIPALVRFNVDGTLDSGFGSAAGTAGAVPMQVGGVVIVPSALVLQGDGRMVVVGTTLGTESRVLTLVRYLESGTIDKAFGADGITKISLVPNFVAGAALQPDGRIVVGGWASPGAQSVFLVRYTPDGASDPTFGSGGIALVARDSAGGLATGPPTLQADGKILMPVGGNGNPAFVVLRFKPDGALDPAFGSSGISVTTLSEPKEGRTEASGIVVRPGVGILISGDTPTNGPGVARPLRDNFALLQLRGDGSPETGFGSAGLVMNPRGDYALGSSRSSANTGRATAMALQPDGKIVQAGYVYDGIDFRLGLSRYRPTGELDAAFGHGGNVLGPQQFGPVALALAGARLYVSGPYAGGGQVVRYLLEAA
ncbi:MAG: hypothetical protein ABI624_11185 [Casimicrobiaceae bacterium]